MNAYPTTGQGWAIILWYLLFSFLAMLLILPFTSSEGLNMSSATFLVVNLLAVSFVSLYGIRKSGNRLVPIVGELGNSNLLIFPVLIVLVGCNILIIDPLVSLIPGAEWFSELMSDSLKPDWPSFISIVLVAPFFEEFILRGIVLEGFLKNYEPKKAIVTSALIFGVLHLNPWQFVGAFLMGLLLGWVYYRTRSLIPCIFIHLVNNLVAFLAFIYVGDDVVSIYDLAPSTLVSVIAIVAAIAGLYFGIKALDRLMAAPQQLLLNN